MGLKEDLEILAHELECDPGYNFKGLMTSDGDKFTDKLARLRATLSSGFIVNWTKCGEGLPKPFTECLVTCTAYRKRKPRVIVATYCVHRPGFHDDETGWFTDDGEMIEPTHYMPKPEPAVTP